MYHSVMRSITKPSSQKQAMNKLRSLIERMGGFANVGKVIGCSRQEIHSWIVGKKPIPITRAFQMEILTNGRIKVKELCPEFIKEIERVKKYKPN